MRILHIAPENVAGVPGTFARTEQQMGHESRLVTLSPDRRGYPEDHCLQLPLFNAGIVRWCKQLVSDPRRLQVSHQPPPPESRPPVWRPGSFLETALITLRDSLWNRTVQRALPELQLDTWDIIQLDGGLGLLRDGRYVRALKAQGKKFIITYLGSDLRTRGIVPHIDSLADLRVTVEFDLRDYYPGILYIPTPFDALTVPRVEQPSTERLRIGHAPSVRAAKGSDQILAVLHKLAAELPIEMELIEGVSHSEALQRKGRCHIFIDQIGVLGYGVNALESLAMGIPVCTCLAPGFSEYCPDHPFIEVTETTLEARLRELIADESLRHAKAAEGALWVRKFHDPQRGIQTMHKKLVERTNMDPEANTCQT
jgi:hypothetical protein